MDSIVNDPTRPPFPLSKNHHSNVYTTTLVKKEDNSHGFESRTFAVRNSLPLEETGSLITSTPTSF